MRASHALNGVLLLLVLWQMGTWLFAPPRYILPSPVDVFAAFSRQPGFLFGQAAITLSEMAAGLAVGIASGIAIAFATAAIPRFGRLVWPMVLVLQAFPVFVLAPILVLWFGFGMASKVAMTAIIIFFPVASAFTDGLNRTDRDILDAASLTQASHWQILTMLRVPLALPSLISGLRVAAPLAPLGAVIGEWVGASAGLGFVMIQSNARMQTDTMFAAMVVLAVMAVLLRLAVDLATARLAPWATESRQSISLKDFRRISKP
ncbi:ABC transporter permease [Agrobacterium tumefaciens]|uniref:ABC transporter permease n=1 Tax=Agrobacterium tumefaciens TaxID=358 RepID=UPI00287EC46F|nr:ABC transporter permease [Agrobacterium tumefaciens]MDS7595597.1 ABC transporter permease [Agrobacterium tumefaciens]